MAKQNPTASTGGGGGSRGYSYNGPIKGPVPKLKPREVVGTPAKPKPKPKPKPAPKPSPVVTPKGSNVGGRAGTPAKITPNQKSDIVKSTYKLWKNPPQPLPKPKPPVAPKVAVTKAAPKPKTGSKPNPVPSGRPPKPTVKNNKPVKPIQPPLEKRTKYVNTNGNMSLYDFMKVTKDIRGK